MRPVSCFAGSVGYVAGHIPVEFGIKVSGLTNRTKIRVANCLCVLPICGLFGWLLLKAVHLGRSNGLGAALLGAVRVGDVARAEEMLRRGASVETKFRSDDDLRTFREDEFTPLAIAASRADEQMTKMLLAHRANPNAATDATERFPARSVVLSAAAERGSLATMKLLLDAGGKVDLSCGMGTTPLMLAVRDNHVEVAELLIHRGANVSARDERGFSVLSFALGKRRQDHTRMIQILRAAGAKS